MELKGESEISGDLVVEGTLVHPLANKKEDAMQLTVGGTLTVPAGGWLHANERSSLLDGNFVFMAYGGAAGPSGSQCSKAYGSISDPMDLGRYSNKAKYSLCKYSGYAGGLIKIATKHLVLNGTIAARGKGCSSGGTVNIKITGSGTVTGTGLIDVSTYSSGSDYRHYEQSGGGRISLTGYSSVSADIVERAKTDGWRGAPGPFYHQEVGQLPEVIVKSTGVATSEAAVAILIPAQVRRLAIYNVKVEVDVIDAADVLVIDDLDVMAKASDTRLTIKQASLKVSATPILASHRFTILVPNGDLNVQGNLTVTASNFITVKDDIAVTGLCTVYGTLTAQAGALDIDALVVSGGTVSQVNAALLNPSTIDNVLLEVSPSTKKAAAFNVNGNIEAGEVVVKKSCSLIAKSNVTIAKNCDLGGTLKLDSEGTTLTVGHTLALIEFGLIDVKGDIHALVVVTKGGSSVKTAKTTETQVANLQIEKGSTWTMAGGRIEAGEVNLAGELTTASESSRSSAAERRLTSPQRSFGSTRRDDSMIQA